MTWLNCLIIVPDITDFSYNYCLDFQILFYVIKFFLMLGDIFIFPKKEFNITIYSISLRMYIWRNVYLKMVKMGNFTLFATRGRKEAGQESRA